MVPFGGHDWLALTQEPTLEPEMPICDRHRCWRRCARPAPTGFGVSAIP